MRSQINKEGGGDEDCNNEREREKQRCIDMKINDEKWIMRTKRRTDFLSNPRHDLGS